MSLKQALNNTCIPRVKICGITNVADGVIATKAGADAIGLVFYKPSPRYVELDTAKQIAQAVGPLVTVVGLFVDAKPLEVQRVLEQVPLHVLQFHGNEAADYCDQFYRPYIKAVRMKPDIDVLQEIDNYSNAQAILLDAYRKGVPGGTGEVFDWEKVPASRVNKSQDCYRQTPIILAGGLTPENVQMGIAATLPYGVDVSGGVEKSPGEKDHTKVREFIERAKSTQTYWQG